MLPAGQLRRAQTMPVMGRSPPSGGVRPGGQEERSTRLGDVRVRVDLGRRQHVAWATHESKASARMREAFLEEAVWRDSAGAIHVEDFGSLLPKPIQVSKWMPDDAADGCRRCKRAFGLWRRRHHCRGCGDLVCADESRARVVWASGAPPARCCDRCLRRTVGRIDALFARRYTRAALWRHSPPTDWRGQPLLKEGGAGLDDGAEIDDDDDARRGVPEAAEPARSCPGLHLRAAGALHSSNGGGGSGSSRDRAADGEPFAGTSSARWALPRAASTASSADVSLVGGESSSRNGRFFRALAASLRVPFGLAAGDASAADIDAAATADSPGENGGGDKDDDGVAAAIVARVSCALLVRLGDGSGRGDDDADVESTDGSGDKEDERVVDGGDGEDDEAGGHGVNYKGGGRAAVQSALGAALAAGGGGQGCSHRGDASQNRPPPLPSPSRLSQSLGDAPASLRANGFNGSTAGSGGGSAAQGRAGSAGGPSNAGEGAAAEPALAFAPGPVLARHADGGAEAAARGPQGGGLGAMLAAAGVVKKSDL